MKKMSSREIREKFLDYFEKNDHLKIKHSSIVPENDPTLLFINSGMAPLKNYFLGRETPPSPRLVNFQPCIRTKDIDDVGDRHHLTIFEMMGSWSIGDYYKELACKLAYDLLVHELGFPPERLYFSVYGGNEKIGIKPDFESVEAWKKCGVPADHIVMLGDDNFWGPAGDSGPCGPCTEVFFDCGDKYGTAYKPGGHFDDVSRYIEIWNAGVFMELNKNKDGTFEPLPLKSVDTGSGLERLAMVMNDCDSVYDTDLLRPLVELSEKLINSKDIRTNRMLADHMRATVMILAEGVLPSNEGQGYIPRRLIRKCVAACISRGVSEIDFSNHVDKTIEILGDFYPQLKSAREAILYNLQQEVAEFVPTVKNGLEMINEELKKNPKSKDLFPGKIAFDLVTTHGLPLEVIKSELDAKKIKFDEAEFEKAYEEHRKTSRVISRKGVTSQDQAKIEEAFLSDAVTEFTGYDLTEDMSKILKIFTTKLSESASAGDNIYFTTQKTPFYGESGGQAGDIGYAVVGNAKIEIQDTMKIKGTHVHVGIVLEGEVKVGELVKLIVDINNKKASMRNHSATHLLHSALHKVVGSHAIQKGSSVSAERLRFDFQNPQAVSKEELEKIEFLVNGWVMQNNSKATDICGYEEAIEKGAMALFGEKYDSKVRVVSFGQDSVELCGGTHVTATGDIGLFLITSETSVAKGIRRIEAVTGERAIILMQERAKILREAADELKSRPEEIAQKIKDLRIEMKNQLKLAKENSGNKSEFEKEIKFEVGGIKVLAGLVGGDAQDLKPLGDDLINRGEYKLVCLIGRDDKSIKAFVWSNDEINKKLKAGDALSNLLSIVNGKGGGRPQFAQGGSPELENITKLTSYIENGFKNWITKSL